MESKKRGQDSNLHYSGSRVRRPNLIGLDIVSRSLDYLAMMTTAGLEPDARSSVCKRMPPTQGASRQV